MSSLSDSIINDTLVLPPTLSDLTEQYHNHALRVRRVSEQTYKMERPYLKRFFNHFGPPDTPAKLFTELGPKSVTDFLVKYASQWGANSRNCMQKTLRLFLHFAYLAGYLATNLSALSPTVHVPRMGRIVRAIPSECTDRLVASIGGHTPSALRDSAIICLLSTYGVRSVQIRRLCLEDVDWAENLIHFCSVKGGRPIEQHLTAKAGNRLLDYITNGRPPSSCKEIFLTLNKPVRAIPNSNHISSMISRRMKKAGVELPEGVRYGSNGFRHAFASRLYGKVPLDNIVDMLGHRDPATTLIYGRIDIPNLRKAALPWPGGEQ